MHVPVVAMRSFRPGEVEEVLEVGRQADQCQRSHAVRWHREVFAGDVHEEVDVAAVPAPEVAALNEVQHLAGPHPKGQKSDAPFKKMGTATAGEASKRSCSPKHASQSADRGQKQKFSMSSEKG